MRGGGGGGGGGGADESDSRIAQASSSSSLICGAAGPRARRSKLDVIVLQKCHSATQSAGQSTDLWVSRLID